MSVLPESFYSQLEEELDKVGTCDDLQRLASRIADQVEAQVKETVNKLIAKNSNRLKPLIKLIEMITGLLTAPGANLGAIVSWITNLISMLSTLQETLLNAFYPSYCALKQGAELLDGLPSEYSRIQNTINSKISEKMCAGLYCPQIPFPPVPDVSGILSPLDALMGACSSEDSGSEEDAASEQDRVRKEVQKTIKSNSWSLDERKSYAKEKIQSSKDSVQTDLTIETEGYPSWQEKYEFWDKIWKEDFQEQEPNVPRNKKGKPIDSMAQKALDWYAHVVAERKVYKTKVDNHVSNVTYYEKKLVEIDGILEDLDKVSTIDEYEKFIDSLAYSLPTAYASISTH